MEKVLNLCAIGMILSLRLFAQDLTTNGMHTIIRNGYPVNWSNSHLELRTNDNTTPWMTFHRSGYSWRALGFDGTDFIDNVSNKFLLSNNYNNYVPTLTGGGASGNWDINAATATSTANWTSYDAGSNNANLTYLMGYNGVTNKYTFYHAHNVRTFLGMPSAGETLQSITDRGNTTNRALETGYDGIRNVLSYTNSGDGQTGVIGTLSNHRLALYSNFSEQVSILPNGNVGIGAISPAYKLDVNGEGKFRNSLTVQSDAAVANVVNVRNGQQDLSLGVNDGAGGAFVFVNSAHAFRMGTSGIERMRITADGNVGIGTLYPGSYKLAVEGTFGARKVKVTQETPWPDYVFDSSYQLSSLQQLETFIRKNKHLPDVLSAAEVKRNGLDLGNSQSVLLKKIEELTLYVIDQNKQLEVQKKVNEEQGKDNAELKSRLMALEKMIAELSKLIL